MKDVQNEPDHRNIDLAKVGIKGIKYPMNVLDRANKTQATVATAPCAMKIQRHENQVRTHPPKTGASMGARARITPI